MKSGILNLRLGAKCALLLGLFPTGLSAEIPLDPFLAQLPVVVRIEKAPVFEFPLVYVGDQPPDQAEANDLWITIDIMRQQGPKVGVPLLEQFIQTYTNSVWIPSLHADLGDYYHDNGRYSLALDHWQAAWEETKAATEGAAKSVADHTLARWTRLLASLGRVETLGEVFQDTWNRTLDAGPLQNVFEGTKEAYGMMLRRPGLSYRCGTLALYTVGHALQSENTNLAPILTTDSPSTGFSLSTLKQLSDQYGLNLVAVFRGTDTNLVVPSVIHWKLNHYAAITARSGNYYRVVDRTFEQTLWIEADVVNAEASGFFLVPFTLKPAGWQILTDAQAGQVFGRGYASAFNDSDPEDCPNDEAGDDEDDPTNPAAAAYPGDPADEPPPCTRSGGPPDNCCTNCAGTGMPVWKVTQPNINLWLDDKPVFYTKSYGKLQAFKLVYNQRNIRPAASYSFRLAPSWECNRMSYFYQSSVGNYVHWVAGGGQRTYPTNGTPEYKSRGVLSVATDGSGNLTYASVAFPTGASETFTNVVPLYSGAEYIYASKQADRYGRSINYNYQTVNGALHLTSVTDSDNRSTTFSYGIYYQTNAIQKITDPWGRVVSLGNDNTNNVMTHISDAGGIGTSLYYDSTTGWLTNMTTPYGTTSFILTGTGNSVPNDFNVDRSCTVILPNGAKELFLYRFDSLQLNPNDTTPLTPDVWPSSQFPTLPYSHMIPNRFNEYSDSWHWDRKQYDALNANFQQNGNYTNWSYLSTNDYFYGTFKHWLADYTGAFLTGTLCMMRQGSPDGASSGQTIWYDYPGKNYDYHEGINSFPQTIAWVLPNGQTSFTYIERNPQNRPILIMTSYADGNSYRTNILGYYSNGVDLQYEKGPNNTANNPEILRGYSYDVNGTHRVTSFTNAVGDVTTYSYDSQARIYQRTIVPTGLTTTYSYGTDGFISQVSDNLSRSQSYTYQNSFVRTYSDMRGMLRTNTWDNLQRLTETDYPDGSSETFGYTYLDLTSQKDRLGNYTYYGYDSLRQKVAETNANSVVTRYG